MISFLVLNKFAFLKFKSNKSHPAKEAIIHDFLLQNYDLIEDNYKYISQGKRYKTSKLDVKNISEGFILYEKLNL